MSSPFGARALEQRAPLSPSLPIGAFASPAKVKALTERRGGGLVRNEGEAECFARGGGRRHYLDRG